MRNNPDDVFRRMTYRRPAPATGHPPEAAPPGAATAREIVYVPQNVKNGTYRRLMQSHDRMGTRHLQR